MVVGDGKEVFFLAPDETDPLPACLDGGDGWFSVKGAIDGEARFDAALMKAPGKTIWNVTSIMFGMIHF